MFQIFNKTKESKVLRYIASSLAVFFTSGISFAYDCQGLTADIAAGEAPNPLSIFCVIGRAFNLALYTAGGVFVLVICYGAWKAAMALGDPKGLEGARNTWTNAVIGLVIVMVFFGVILAVLKAAGITSIGGPADILSRLEQGMSNFLNAAGIQDY